MSPINNLLTCQKRRISFEFCKIQIIRGPLRFYELKVYNIAKCFKLN